MHDVGSMQPITSIPTQKGTEIEQPKSAGVSVIMSSPLLLLRL